MEKKQTRYIPVPLWNDFHVWPTVVGLRYLIFNKDKNGFAKVVKKIGKRVLIDEILFFEWVEEQNSEKNE